MSQFVTQKMSDDLQQGIAGGMFRNEFPGKQPEVVSAFSISEKLTILDDHVLPQCLPTSVI